MKYSFYLCCVLRNKGLKIVFLKGYNCRYKKLSLWKDAVFVKKTEGKIKMRFIRKSEIR